MEPEGSASAPIVIEATKDIWPGTPSVTVLEDDLETILRKQYTSLIQSSEGRWACPKCYVSTQAAGMYWTYLHVYGYERFQGSKADTIVSSQFSVDEVTFDSEYSYDKTSEAKSVAGSDSDEDFKVAFFRREAEHYHKTPWDRSYYKGDCDGSDFACFLNPPQAYRCLNRQTFYKGQLRRESYPCNFSRERFPGFPHQELEKETWENKKELQSLLLDLKIAVPSASIPARKITHFACPLCTAWGPNLKEHPEWDEYVKTKPEYQPVIYNARADIFKSVRETEMITADGWMLFVNSLTDSTEEQDAPKANMAVPGIRCNNRKYGQGAKYPNLRCPYEWGNPVAYGYSPKWGVYSFNRFYRNGPSFDEPATEVPGLNVVPMPGTLTEMHSSWSDSCQDTEPTPESCQKSMGMCEDGTYVYDWKFPERL